MSHLSVKPLDDNEQDLLDSLQALPISAANEGIYKDTSSSFANRSFGGGGGDVVGPASAVNSNFAAFNTTTGKLIKDSGVNESLIIAYAIAL